ncbi:MAG: universal stress protein [Rhodocyclaceae bacterium]|nr:universal stress protein [Rhodocyclaceae bacterium]
MELKNLMVHLDQDARTAVRLDMAVAIAKRHQARLVGLFGQRAKPQQVGVVATWPPEDYAQAAEASQAAFRKATSGLADAEWQDLNRGGDAALLALVTANARHADLMILGQHDGNPHGHVPPELAEEVIVNSGRPVLVVPFVGEYASGFKRPLIAWNDSREAAHALNDALPLIEGCQEAIVLSFDTRFDQAEASCQAVARHLACHGVSAQAEVLVVEDVGIMDMLLNRVADHGADLLVMGAHGQIGFPFVSRGSGTRHILRSMTVPVLMAN